MRVIFMGTPDFAVPALRELIASPHEIVAVYSQPPRPAGRGMKLTASPVHRLADAHGIPVFTPASLKSAEAQREFADHEADIAVVAAYGLLLPQPVLDAPKFGCINLHPSDLPRWRGAAPIQRTLMAGDRETACCIMQLERGLDTGPVLLREPYAIPPGMDAGGLHHVMAECGAMQLLTVLEHVADGTVIRQAQSAGGITYAEKITKADRVIDWRHPATELVNQIRGLSPAPGAITDIQGETVKLYRAEALAGDKLAPPGKLLGDDLVIQAGQGTALRILELQRPGKNRQTGTQFMQAISPASEVMAQNTRLN